MSTTILFKTDKKLKEKVQRTAKRMGIPFSAVMNRLMEEFAERQEITFSAKPLTPTPYLRRILEQGEKNLKEGKVRRFNGIEELMADLNS